jgi:hypothetical protein
MNRLAAIAVKTAGAGATAALLSLGVAGDLAQAASPSPKPAPSASAPTTKPDRHQDRRAVAKAVFESEADVLGLTPKALRADLKSGQTIAGLAKDRGMTKEQFAAKLVTNLRPRLAKLVDAKVITQAQAGKITDWISKGHIPFWDRTHHRHPKPPTKK